MLRSLAYRLTCVCVFPTDQGAGVFQRRLPSCPSPLPGCAQAAHTQLLLTAQGTHRPRSVSVDQYKLFVEVVQIPLNFY